MKHFRLALAGMALIVGATAYAGYQTSSRVSIDNTNAIASGDMGVARRSPDANEYIGCVVYVASSAPTPGGYCIASAGSSYASCFTSSSLQVNVIAGLAGDDNVRFMWDGSGNCAFIATNAASYTKTKGP